MQNPPPAIFFASVCVPAGATYTTTPSCCTHLPASWGPAPALGGGGARSLARTPTSLAQRNPMLQQLLLASLLDAAAASKDTSETRQQQLPTLLTLLTASAGETSWFPAWLAAKLSAVYPCPSRSLLDAVLQAFIAASPRHCSLVLPALLRIPGSTSLNAPLRRDVSVLFRPNPLLPSAWQQQVSVTCSIVVFLATEAANACQQQHQATAPAAAQQAGTVIGWLSDCLLQAPPQHKLHLLQLALAAFTRRYANLQQQQQASEQASEEPPAKRQCLEEQQQQQQPGVPTAGSATSTTTSSSSSRERTASLPTLQAGLQFLCACCSSETMQRGSQQLLPLAAAAAAEVAALAQPADTGAQLLGSAPFKWLLVQLCSQASAASIAAAAAAAAAKAAAAAAGGDAAAASTQDPAAAGVGAVNGVQPQLGLSAPTPPGLTPGAALIKVVQRMVSAGPHQLPQLVQLLMEQQHTAGNAAAADTQLFHSWLLEAATQWRQTASGGAAGSAVAGGRGRGKGRQGGSSNSKKGTALTVEQLLPPAAPVTASWVCKHLVPCLCSEAVLEQQQQGSGIADAPAASALLQLLAADGLLLPASGEVLVSARALAEALSNLPAQLQESLVLAWQELQPLLPWPTLQPMLCLLDHLGELDASPLAGFLATAVHACCVAAAAGPATAVVKHLLLPLRFKLQVPARVWLLRQLLSSGQHRQSSDDAQTAVGAQVLQALVALLTQPECAAQLAHGLQQLAAEADTEAGGGGAVTAARDLADAVVQLHQKLGEAGEEAQMRQLGEVVRAADAASAARLLVE